MVRATHGVCSGSWYFEAIIQEMPDNSASRIGWAMPSANLQVRFDKNFNKIQLVILFIMLNFWTKYVLKPAFWRS